MRLETQPDLFDGTEAPRPRRKRFVRPTSARAVQSVNLKGRMARVSEALSKCSAPVTAGELTASRTGLRPSDRYEFQVAILNTRRGLTDLKLAGLVEACEARRCQVTKRQVQTWRLK